VWFGLILQSAVAADGPIAKCRTHYWSAGGYVNLDATVGWWDDERLEFSESRASEGGSTDWTARHFVFDEKHGEYREAARWQITPASPRAPRVGGIELRGISGGGNGPGTLALERGIGWIGVNNKPRTYPLWVGKLDSGVTAGNADVRFVCHFQTERLGLFGFDLPLLAQLVDRLNAGLAADCVPTEIQVTAATLPHSPVGNCQWVDAATANAQIESAFRSALTHLGQRDGSPLSQALLDDPAQMERRRWLEGSEALVCVGASQMFDFEVFRPKPTTSGRPAGLVGFRFVLNVRD